MTFDDVTGEGETTIARTSAPVGCEASGTFLVDGGVYYSIESTARFTGVARVCIETSAPSADLYHCDGGAWVKVTTSSSGGRVCGSVEHFSSFAVGVPKIEIKQPEIKLKTPVLRRRAISLAHHSG